MASNSNDGGLWFLDDEIPGGEKRRGRAIPVEKGRMIKGGIALLILFRRTPPEIIIKESEQHKGETQTSEQRCCLSYWMDGWLWLRPAKP